MARLIIAVHVLFQLRVHGWCWCRCLCLRACVPVCLCVVCLCVCIAASICLSASTSGSVWFAVVLTVSELCVDQRGPFHVG